MTSDNARYKANSTAIGTYGSENVSWSRDEVLAVDRAGLSNWDEKKIDSRDLLGAVVTIKSTFANFLDVWPEYSVIKSSFSNTIEMYTTSPYRVGDNVKSSKGDTEATIQAIEENRFLFLDRELETGTTRGDAVYIVNGTGSKVNNEKPMPTCDKNNQARLLPNQELNIGILKESTRGDHKNLKL